MKNELEDETDSKITLTFTEKQKYQLEFYPPDFWRSFAEGYDALSWSEISDSRVAVIAESYSYLIDMLVQARLFYISAMTMNERLK